MLVFTCITFILRIWSINIHLTIKANIHATFMGTNISISQCISNHLLNAINVAIVGKHTVTSTQIITFFTKTGHSIFDSSDGQIEACILLYKCLTDKDNFKLVIDKCFSYKDEKEEIVKKLGLDIKV